MLYSTERNLFFIYPIISLKVPYRRSILLRKSQKSGIVRKPVDIITVPPKKFVINSSSVIPVLVTLLMLSGIVISYAQAADPLIVDFNATPISGVRPLDVQFLDATIAADPANNTYLWNFGDGNTSTEKNPPHTYVSSGIYTVNFTVTEISNNNATLSKPYYIHVADTLNATDFSGIPKCGLRPLSVQFIDGTVLPHDQWEWNFGDNGTSNLSDPLHIYNGEGSWSVSLHIWNNSGGPQSIISKTDYIQVIPAGVTSFSVSGTGTQIRSPFSSMTHQPDLSHQSRIIGISGILESQQIKTHYILIQTCRDYTRSPSL